MLVLTVWYQTRYRIRVSWKVINTVLFSAEQTIEYISIVLSHSTTNLYLEWGLHFGTPTLDVCVGSLCSNLRIFSLCLSLPTCLPFCLSASLSACLSLSLYMPLPSVCLSLPLSLSLSQGGDTKFEFLNQPQPEIMNVILTAEVFNFELEGGNWPNLDFVTFWDTGTMTTECHFWLHPI